MPRISLVVCLYKERDLLERLLQHAEGCYDGLVVVHDGPEWVEAGQCGMRDAACGDAGSQANLEFKIQDPESLAASQVFVPSHRWPGMAVDFSLPEQAAKAAHFWNKKTGPPQAGSIHELVAKYGGRFFEGPRCWQQEPHWPFAWAQAKHNWILRLDADEFPSIRLREWLVNFRALPEPTFDISGYTCIWPLWNGHRATTSKWPAGRKFLFDRRRVRFFGMAEQVPIPDRIFSEQKIVLNHQPARKSYGVKNILFRKQAYRWRTLIALTLLETPLHLPRWNWTTPEWPPHWNYLISHPIECAFKRGLLGILRQFWHVLRIRGEILPSAFLGTGLHQTLMAFSFLKIKSRKT